MTATRDDAKCDRCAAFPRWSICNLEGDDLQPITRWFACGRHLHSVLAEGDWEVDCVYVYDFEHSAGAAS